MLLQHYSFCVLGSTLIMKVKFIGGPLDGEIKDILVEHYQSGVFRVASRIKDDKILPSPRNVDCSEAECIVHDYLWSDERKAFIFKP